MKKLGIIKCKKILRLIATLLLTILLIFLILGRETGAARVNIPAILGLLWMCIYPFICIYSIKKIEVDYVIFGAKEWKYILFSLAVTAVINILTYIHFFMSLLSLNDISFGMMLLAYITANSMIDKLRAAQHVL